MLLMPSARPPTGQAAFTGHHAPRIVKVVTVLDQGPLDQQPTRWQPNRLKPAIPWSMPALGVALTRGLAMHCPACGKTKLFRGYLTVTPVCPNCGAPLGLARADDAPPYFTIVAVGHIVIPSMLFVEKTYQPPLWVHTAIWVPLTIVLALGFLRPIKGATVGLMLKLGMFKTSAEA